MLVGRQSHRVVDVADRQHYLGPPHCDICLVRYSWHRLYLLVSKYSVIQIVVKLVLLFLERAYDLRLLRVPGGWADGRLRLYYLKV